MKFNKISSNIENDKTIMKLHSYLDKGKVTFVALMPGLYLLYNEFNINEHIDVEYIKSKDKIIEINYCQSGRFGCTIQKNRQVFLGKGEIEANIASIEKINPEFPLGYYKGISIVIDIEEIEKQLCDSFEEISNKIIELHKFLYENDFATLIKSDLRMIKIFRELYEEKEQVNVVYLRLKVLELITLLQLSSIDRNKIKKQYFSATDIKKIKNARNEVISNLEIKITLDELSEKYKISLTNFKKCFKEVYGSPYYTYLKRYKIHKAVHYLEETKLSVSEIALKIGYENTSKFISVFKELTGYTPREYRNKNVRLEHLDLFGVELKNEK